MSAVFPVSTRSRPIGWPAGLSRPRLARNIAIHVASYA